MSSEKRNQRPGPNGSREEAAGDSEDAVEAQDLVAEDSVEEGELIEEEPEIVEVPEEEPVPGEEVVDGERASAPEEEELTAIKEELELTRRERDEYLDALRRLKAEFENFRKRQERELTLVRNTASEKLVTELLPVLDNLDRALEAEGDVREGVRATREHFASVLGEAGLAPVSSDGQHFDPNVHEAVMGQPSEEHEEGIILQTFERGYLLNGKPIRPAKVVVARQA